MQQHMDLSRRIFRLIYDLNSKLIDENMCFLISIRIVINVICLIIEFPLTKRLRIPTKMPSEIITKLIQMLSFQEQNSTQLLNAANELRFSLFYELRRV